MIPAARTPQPPHRARARRKERTLGRPAELGELLRARHELRVHVVLAAAARDQMAVLSRRSAPRARARAHGRRHLGAEVEDEDRVELVVDLRHRGASDVGRRR
jgi:hypothetical protein